jgi:predicted site-specific integrase-resolvase
MSKKKKLLSVAEWAKKHNENPRNAYNWVRSGKLPSERVSVQVIRIPEDATPKLRRNYAK